MYRTYVYIYIYSYIHTYVYSYVSQSIFGSDQLSNDQPRESHILCILVGTAPCFLKTNQYTSPYVWSDLTFFDVFFHHHIIIFTELDDGKNYRTTQPVSW